MRWLLVGNGPADDGLEAAAARADAILQINACRHADRLPPGRTRILAISNSGRPEPPILPELARLRRHPSLAGARLLATRNPRFYRACQRRLMADGVPGAGDFAPDPALWALRRDWRLGIVSAACSAALDALLLRHGMPPGHMPSTGMVAWFWLRRRLRPSDEIDLRGFTHEGWFRHPWAIERVLMREPSVLPAKFVGLPTGFADKQATENNS